MKSLKMRNALILVLSFVFALSMFIFAGSVKTASAAEVGTSIGTWQIMPDASIRCSSTNAGLRFRVQMDYQTASYVKSSGDNVTLGFIVTPKYYFDNRAAETVEEGQTATYGADDYILSIERYVSQDKGGIIVDKDNIYVSDTAGENVTEWTDVNTDIASEGTGLAYYANAAVTNILEANRALDFTAIAYIKTVDGETTEYTYAVPAEEDFARNVQGTASAAYWAKEENRAAIHTSFDWFATKSNPIQISNSTQYDTFASNTATETFKDKYVEISEPIDLGSGDGSELTKVSANFTGTLSVASGATLVYDNTTTEGQAPVLADEGSAAASVLADTIEVYDSSKINLKPVDMTVYYKWQETNDYSTTSASYVSAEEIATINEKNGIVDDIAWNKDIGDAVKYTISGVTSSSYNYYQRVEVPYTSGAYQIFYENDKFDAVAFQYMIQTDASVTTLQNRNAGYHTLMSAIGYYTSSWIADPTTKITTNTWMSGIAEVDKFITSIVDDNKLTLIRSLCNTEFTFYLSELQFIDYDWTNHVEWAGSQNVEPSESTKVGFNSGSYTLTYMTNAEVLDEVAVVNPDAYDGDVIKISAVPHNKYIYPYTPYVNTDYEKLYKNDIISKVRLTYMVTSSDGVTSYCYDTSCFIGLHAKPENSLAKWITVEFDLTYDMNWVANSGTLFRYTNRIYYMRTKALGSTRTFDIYMGRIEFI